MRHKPNVICAHMLRGLRPAKGHVRPETDVEVVDPDGVSGWWIDLLSDQAREGLEKWRERQGKGK